MAVVFEISGRMAMYRKPYTTTSSISFAFPPPTAIAGLICGIIGLSNDSDSNACNAKYWEHLKGTKISIAICNNIAWKQHSINFWNVKEPQKNPHIQIKHQFVVNPKYRIYVEGGVEKELQQMVEKALFKYTPYLGVAYAIADIKYIGQYKCIPLHYEEKIQIDTVIPWSKGIEFYNIINTGGAFKEQMPFKMDATRRILQSIAVIYPPTPQSKLAISKRGESDVSKCGNDVVAWFPSW
ncbi:MAG: type I-B CRISPR-associated protein Cas5b [Aminobacterium colombiense]|jgi:CRISPR-associated protein Cas5h|uniref:type I-B CRISPR-associated protein Cas5b n=1 Tax=Aminobacterium colombiense TaxID=81468 RepID=UPI003D967941